MCTCAKFRKRIEPVIPGHGINLSTLDSNVGTEIKTSGKGNRMSSDLGDSPDRPQYTEYKELRKRDESGEELGADGKSPNPSRHSQPRMSQDFKMRILTKKKVAVPPSAAS